MKKYLFTIFGVGFMVTMGYGGYTYFHLGNEDFLREKSEMLADWDRVDQDLDRMKKVEDQTALSTPSTSDKDTSVPFAGITPDYEAERESRRVQLENEVQAEVGNEYGWETSFSHVAPGSYSEVYSTVTNLKPGEAYELTLKNSAGQESMKSVEADSDGVAKFTWRITSYGTYTILDTTGKLPDQSKTLIVK